MESTRIIPLSGKRADAEDPNPSNVIRMEPDTGLIKLATANGREAVSGADGESGQRFANEVKYISYYAQRLADTLGMHQLQIGIIEDREGQTAFQTVNGGWVGALGGSRKSVKQVKESLARG